MQLNKKYMLSLRNIVKTDDGYVLQKVYKENENGEIVETLENKNNENSNGFIKNCYICVHNRGMECLLRTKLENAPYGHYYSNYYMHKCDAYEPVELLNIIHNEEEMIQFIEKTRNFFTEENYELYYGFERLWDEGTGDILETVREYYNRGGKFKNIPTKYPAVIFFGLADIDGEYTYHRDSILKWIFVGEEI